VRVKLEKVLGISLLDVSDEEVKRQKGDRLATTVGDIIKIKRE